jgi:hypothetical protein
MERGQTKVAEALNYICECADNNCDAGFTEDEWYHEAEAEARKHHDRQDVMVLVPEHVTNRCEVLAQSEHWAVVVYK